MEMSSFRIQIGNISRRPNGISHCENREQKPQNLTFPLHDVDPDLIQQCLGPPHAPPQTAAPTVKALSHTDAEKSPLVTMVHHKSATAEMAASNKTAKYAGLTSDYHFYRRLR